MELAGGGGGDLGDDRDQAGDPDPHPVADDLEGVGGPGPDIAGGPLRGLAMQGDGVGVNGGEHLAIVEIGGDHGAAVGQPDTAAVG